MKETWIARSSWPMSGGNGDRALWRVRRYLNSTLLERKLAVVTLNSIFNGDTQMHESWVVWDRKERVEVGPKQNHLRWPRKIGDICACFIRHQGCVSSWPLDPMFSFRIFNCTWGYCITSNSCCLNRKGHDLANKDGLLPELFIIAEDYQICLICVKRFWVAPHY